MFTLFSTTKLLEIDNKHGGGELFISKQCIYYPPGPLNTLKTKSPCKIYSKHQSNYKRRFMDYRKDTIISPLVNRVKEKGNSPERFLPHKISPSPILFSLFPYYSLVSPNPLTFYNFGVRAF